MTHPQAAQAVMLARYTLDDDVNGVLNLGTDTESNLIPAPAEASTAGGPTYSATDGKLDGYAIFSGNQALVANTAGNAADDLAGYPFTLSAWIRIPTGVTSITSRGAAVGMINGAAAGEYFSLGTETSGEGNDLQGTRRNTTFVSTEGVGTQATIFDNNWHHVAVVNPNASKSRLYLDGVQVGISSTTVNFSTGVNQLSIGGMRRSAGWIDEFAGHIDEVSLYDEALVPEQIQFIMNNIGVAPASVAPCDVNVSGGCTIDDLQIIANNFYTSVPTRGMGDLNEDGFVNFADYRIWKDTSGSAATLESLGIPEPGSIFLITLGLPWLGMRRRKR